MGRPVKELAFEESVQEARRRFLTLGLTSLAGLVLANEGRSAVDAPAPEKANPLDEPLRLIGLAQASYARVRDYTCTVSKREQVRGKLSAPALIQMRARTSPFAIHLRWLEPAELKGQEALFVTGKHDGKIRVRPPGLLAAVGFVSISPDDPRVLEMSRHNITQAGIGNIIERYGQGWERERHLNLTQVHVEPYDFDRRRCLRVETIHPSNEGNVFVHYRSVVYFDAETYLPLRVEGYDWPRPGEQPDLMEVYSFVNLKVNVGLPEAVFKR